MITITHFYLLAGLILLTVAGLSLRDHANPKRMTSALFWALYGLLFLCGDHWPPALIGGLVLLTALVAGLGWVGRGSEQQLPPERRRDLAQRLGNRLFVPSLLIPAFTVIGALLLKDVKIGGQSLLDPANLTMVCLGMACIAAVAAGCYLTGSNPVQSMRETRRLLESIGWAFILPQMLATLGLLFADAGVGKAVSYLATNYLPMDSRVFAVATYAIAMALFTMIMGNAFAAFPVITAGIGIPVLLGHYHGNPAIMAAIGMFSGYCGTLMTPMAANFNIVPAALLELSDKNAVIKMQIPTALMVLLINIILLNLLMFN